MALFREASLTVNLIAQDEQIILVCNLSDLLELIPTKRGTSWVVWVI